MRAHTTYTHIEERSTKRASSAAEVVHLLDAAPGDRQRLPRGVPEVGQLSCRVVVFMDQAAEDITAAELSCDQRLRLAMAL